MAEEKKTGNFNTKVRPILTYVGTIGASLMVVAYIVIVFIMVFGFSVANFTQSLLFAIVNAVIGMIIMQFLKIQGIDLAKLEEENKNILKEYYDLKPKEKKHHSIKYFWVTSVIKDILTKVITIAATSAGLIYIVIVGSKDYTLFLLAVVNLIMFICFGLLSLVSAFDFFNEKHIPYLKEKLQEIKDEAKNKKAMEMVARKPIESRNDSVHANRGSNLLESSGDNGAIGVDCESLVVDSNKHDNCILGGAIHPSSTITDGADIGDKEIIQENSEEKEC